MRPFFPVSLLSAMRRFPAGVFQLPLYKTAEYVPGYIGFGSSGGGELFAFDKSFRIVMIPFIPMNEDEAILLAESWEVFEKAINRQ